jgi:hypothetical protein
MASEHSFNTGNVVRLSKRYPARKAASGPYEIVAQLPERDGQFQYRIKSGCEPFYRTVAESELELDGGAVTSDLIPDQVPLGRAFKQRA